MKFKLFTFLSAILISLLSVLFVGTKPALADENQTGSISVCKIVVDENNNIVIGSDKPGSTFSISGFTPNPDTSKGPAVGVLPTTTFTTPLTYNSHVLAGTQGNDAQCVTYNNLALGSYYWTQESNPASGWDAPFYSDQYTGQATSVVNLYSYENNLFDDDQSNDGSRNLDSDGHILLTPDRQTRILIVVNRYKTTNSHIATSTGGASFTTTCNDTPPGSVPVLKSVIIGQNSATLTWTEAGNPVSYYYINYGTQPGKYIYGNTNVGGKGTTSYTVNGLSSGTKYYFVVGAGNGCKPGPYSNELSNTPGESTITSESATEVLGTEATPTPTEAKDVNGFSTIAQSICSSCVWWPILLSEAVALTFFYGMFRKTKIAQKRKYLFGSLIAATSYIIFLIINRNCSAGVMNFIFFSLPCVYFWMVDLVTYLSISFIFKFREQK